MSSEASCAVPCASVWTLSLVTPRELPRLRPCPACSWKGLSAQSNRAIGIDVDGNGFRVEFEPIRRLRLGDRVIGIDRKGGFDRSTSPAASVASVISGSASASTGVTQNVAPDKVVVALARVCLVDAELDRRILLDEHRT